MQRRIEKEKKKKPQPFPEIAGLIQKGRQALTRLSDGFWDMIAEDLAAPRIRAGKRLISALLVLTCAALCVLACTAAYPLDIYPAPLALLCAMGGFGIRRGKSCVSAGSVCAVGGFSVFFSCIFLPGGAIYAAVLLIVLLVRLSFTGGKLCDGLLFRLSASALGAFVFALCEIILNPQPGGFWRLIAFVLGTPVLTFLLCGAYLYFATRENQLEAAQGRFTLSLLRHDRQIYLTAALLGVQFCVLYAIRDAQPLGISLALVLGAVLGLLAARRSGAVNGALFGAAAGLAASGNTAGIMLGVLCFFGGMLFSRSLLLGTAAGFVLAGGYLLYFAPAASFSLFGADLFLGAALFLPVSLLRIPTPKQEKKRAVSKNTAALLQKKLAALSAAFSSLSEVFYMATDRSVTPAGQLAARLTREATGRICVKCKCSTDCWERNYGLTQSALTSLSLCLADRRRVSPEDMEPYFRTRCEKAPALCAEINRRYIRECGGFDTPEMPAALLCGEYGSVSRLLRSTAEELHQSEAQNAAATKVAARVLESLGVPHRLVYVTGGRAMRVEVRGIPMHKLSLSTQKLTEAFSQELGVRFGSPEFLPPLQDATLVLRRARALSLTAARAVRAKGGESISGDTAGFFESETEYFYALICDGMGSGRNAAFTSRLASIFIEKLLTFSAEKGVTLEMLNRFLLSQREERFSTVDLCEIDFYTGKANFIKAGAAPSFIKRGTGLYRIESATPPAGILHTLSAEQTSLSLMSGDQVVMFSDGVADGSFAWFAETLAFAKQQRAEELSKYLISKAREHHGGVVPDDMSVTVLNVQSA